MGKKDIENDCLPVIGKNLREARKKVFPKDRLEDFAIRVGVARATLQRMEKGDLSVSLGRYLEAAWLLKLDDQFDTLLKREAGLFED